MGGFLETLRKGKRINRMSIGRDEAIAVVAI